MKVLFVYPALDAIPGINHGLAALSGVLKGRGHETRLVHAAEHLAPAAGMEPVARAVVDFRPDLVGFSILTQQYPWCLAAARELRKRFPELTLAAGGVHCSMVPAAVAASGAFDLVFVGEADEALPAVLDRLARGEDPAGSPGVWVRRPDGLVAAAPPAPFPDLARLAPKDYDLFDLEACLKAKSGWLSVLTSRGCPYRCSYCLNHRILELYLEGGAAQSPRQYLRRYPVPRIIGELENLTGRYPEISTIIIDDDLFTQDHAYVREFCRAYRRAGIDRPFVVNAHVLRFNDEVAGELRAAGCTIVKFGLESGSPRIRAEVLNRRMSDETIARAFAAADRAGLHTSAFVMIGLPREGRPELEATIATLARLKVGRFRWSFFYPFPGTDSARLAEADGLVEPDAPPAGGNYFTASPLKFAPAHALLLDKLGALLPWWVNAAGDWPAAGKFAGLVRELEGLDAPAWAGRREEFLARERELSDRLLAAGELHYSVRYLPVMGVRSDFVAAERAGGSRPGRPLPAEAAGR